MRSSETKIRFRRFFPISCDKYSELFGKFDAFSSGKTSSQAPASATCKLGCALYRLRIHFLLAGLRSDVFQIESFLFDFQFQQLFTITYHFEVTLPLVIDE